MQAAESQARAARILVVDDDAGVRQSLRLCLEPIGASVLGVGTAQGALDALGRSSFDAVLLDLWLGTTSGLDVLPEILARQPGVGVLVVTAFATFESAVEAMRRGAADYLPKPFTPDQVRIAVKRVIDSMRLRQRVVELEETLLSSDVEAWFDSSSPAFRNFLVLVQRAAASESPVLLRGESGTGKNVLAHWIRRNSPRRDGPFVSVNCPALSPELLSSTLFGHKRGAFTGAVADVPGKVQEAEGGTLFLDEVGDLSPDAQSRLLRFLNDRTYERLGESRERQADVRLVAATNRDLEADVSEGRFREDLLFRLDVLSLTIPPLRERTEDVLGLAEHFLRFFSAKLGRSALAFSDSARDAMVAHDWPGNLRELRNSIERAVILTGRDVLEPAALGLSTDRGARTPELGDLVGLEEIEREHIARIILRCSTLEHAAKVLGIDATTLKRKRKRYGLS